MGGTRVGDGGFQVGEVLGDSSKVAGVHAGFGMNEAEAIGDGTGRAMTFMGELSNGLLFDAIEAENGQDGWGFHPALDVELADQLEGATCHVFIEVFGLRIAEAAPKFSRISLV
jgi:hypothetical protein